MKIFKIIFMILMLSPTLSLGQINYLYITPSPLKIIFNINNTVSPPAYWSGYYYTDSNLVWQLVGDGITVFNIWSDTFAHMPGPNWRHSYSHSYCGVFYGKFVWRGAPSDIGIDSGVVLSTGWVPPVQNPINEPIPGMASGIPWPAKYNVGARNPGGYSTNTAGISRIRDKQFPDLVAINYGDSIGDANIFEFDFVPDSNHFRLQYVFASEEYPDMNDSTYPTTVCDKNTDFMAIFLSRPGIQGEKNIALVPGTNLPVAANTIRPQGWDCPTESAAPGNGHSQYYVDNTGNQNLIYNGYTTVLTAQSAVIPKDTYHLRIAVAEAAPHPEIPDSIWYNVDRFSYSRYGYYDSGIFLKAGSLVSYSVDTTSGTDTSGTDTSGTGIISVKSNQWAVEVWPNPFSHSFQLKTDKNNIRVYRLQLFDAAGKRILHLEGTIPKINSQLARAHLAHLPPGNYFLNLWRKEDGKKRTIKLEKRE